MSYVYEITSKKPVMRRSVSLQTRLRETMPSWYYRLELAKAW